MRPFEFGDLIVTAHGVKTVISIDNSKPVFIGGIEKTVWRIRTETGFYRECDVKTIRKPRKGSKEARDIVAMLAHSYWKSLKALSKGWIDGDRKSTRLNSSHITISYAVFCLK